jgi:hypothetical protein
MESDASVVPSGSRKAFRRLGTIGLGLAVCVSAAAGPAAAAPAAAAGGCVSPVMAAVEPFELHMKYAHFERSVPDQISDILATDMWVKAHTTLVQAMLTPLQLAAAGVPDGTLEPFFAHMKYAHFERSPMAQIDDIKATDQWVKAHTALIGAMSGPSAGMIAGC